MAQAKEIRREAVAEGRFLKYERIIWQDKNGDEKVWETLERRHDGSEAVMIIPWIAATGDLVLIRQFRPPAKGYIYEFPAGLIDAGETPPEAALRELREETGYTGEVISVVDPTFNTPGMSGETVYCVFMELPEGQNPQLDLQDSEDIEVVLVARSGIEDFVCRELEAGSKFDTKAFMYLTGIITEEKLKSSGAGVVKNLPWVKS